MDIMKKIRDGECRAGQKGLRQWQWSPERSAEQKVGPVVMKRSGRKGSNFTSAKSSPLSDSLSASEAGKRKGRTETETKTNVDIAGHTSLYDMMQKLSASKPKPHVQESAEGLMDGHKTMRCAQWHHDTACHPPPSPHLDGEADRRRSHSCVPHLKSIPASSGSSDESISLEQLMREAAQKRKDRERERRSPGETSPFPAGDISISSSKAPPPREGQETPEADDQEDGEGDVSLADMLVQVSQKKKGRRAEDPQRSVDSAEVRELADAKEESDSKAAVKQVDAKNTRLSCGKEDEKELSDVRSKESEEKMKEKKENRKVLAEKKKKEKTKEAKQGSCLSKNNDAIVTIADVISHDKNFSSQAVCRKQTKFSPPPMKERDNRDRGRVVRQLSRQLSKSSVGSSSPFGGGGGRRKPKTFWGRDLSNIKPL
uniref:Uncharacterized protein n=1 Tax=Chromera velia CCMP2878 TaxID=1169474 RepID=A0A0G4FVF7_9ALVE|eukprot:Cvel_3768.t1-p1 / transcript=Cvel_3768.t1 / gene=Cvel_3768 / organism=Chromera_velia_CCMP2878 / gene_product=hypothetical protein / transcript_product=hypothetical protein / location=Cvel_scaffold158:12234-13762(+) / protein_length=427 / sequence_SO=supercontig / SO=protein_coding / is_pseudo=false